LSKEYKGPVRIKDIASLAGVSAGTVDRVIHGRGKVSEENERKIKAAIAKLDYKPNMMARSLARKKDFEIAVLLPSTKQDSFWKAQNNGIQRAYKDIKDFGFQVTVVEFKDQIEGDLLKAFNTIVKKPIDALLLAPTTVNESHEVLDRCNQMNIPYILVNTNLNREDEQYLGYVGQDSFQSGVLGAQLLSMTTDTNGKLALFHMENLLEQSIHMLQKEKGFLSFFENDNDNRQIEIASIPALQKPKDLEKDVSKFLKANPDTKGIFVTTSRIHYLIEVLKRIGRPDISAIGFDLIDENIEALSSYEKMMLINQNPERQAYLL